MNAFSFRRFWAMVLKEFIQMRRDRTTFAMMIGIPLAQLMLFGFAINSDPRNLPTVVRDADGGPYARALVRSLELSGYFRVVRDVATDAEAARLLETGEVQFVLNIPADFSRGLLRGERPQVLLEADATDPAATGSAIGAVNQLMATVVDRDLPAHRRGGVPAVDFVVHRHYNPEGITQYNVVPGLMGVVLTMTMVIITSLAITRERERGTMENLLATPVRPIEVMTGKIVPYILVGYVQVGLILLAARFLFSVPMVGSLPLLAAVTSLFIAANLAMGITFSTVAKNQLQAVQMAFFFFLPSLLLSGFMFPFRGMPEWAQNLGSVLPLTHFLRIVRGVLLKGNGVVEIMPHVWPLLAFVAVVMTIALKRYRQTLD